MRPIVLFLTVWLPVSAGAMELGGIPTPATRMQRGVTCTFAAGQPPRCSDGRLIATARSTPVPCEQQQGVFTDVPPNVACVTWDGRLEAYSATTTLIRFGDVLTNAAWTGGTATAAAQGYTVTGSRSQAMTALGAAQTRTTAWILRRGTSSTATIGTQATGGCAVTLTDEWATYSCTEALTTGVVPQARLTVASGNVLAMASWHTATATPGRPCFGTNAAGTTCDGERHTISTAGFPTTQGEICITSLNQERLAGAPVVLIDGRTASGNVGPVLSVANSAGRMDFISDDVTLSTPSGTWVDGSPMRACAGRKDGALYMIVNGVRYQGAAAPPLGWQPIASFGRGRLAAYQGVNGSLSSLSWRAK